MALVQLLAVPQHLVRLVDIALLRLHAACRCVPAQREVLVAIGADEEVLGCGGGGPQALEECNVAVDGDGGAEGVAVGGGGVEF